jgi:hypothetical protein
MTLKMISSTTVNATETSREPKHPRPLEKKRNKVGRDYPAAGAGTPRRR